MTNEEKSLPTFPPVRSLEGMLCVISQLRAQYEAIFAGMESYAHAAFAVIERADKAEFERIVREACDYEYSQIGECEAFGALAEALGVPEDEQETQDTEE